MLSGRALFLIEVRELFALFSQALQERSRLPKFAMLLVKLLDALENFFQANRVGVPHRPAAIGWETVAVEVDDVDIDGAQCESFFKDARTLVHQSVDAAIHDFLPGYFALRNSGFGGPLADQQRDFRIRNGAAVFVIFVPASARLLPETAHLAEIVSRKSLANSGLLQVAIFFPDSPSDIETGEIPDGERPHGHSEIVERGIDRLNTSAFFQKKNRLADIRMKHSIADKSAAVPYQDANLANFLAELHAG